MAKNKIEVDVKVDDKGTTKKVALESKKAADGLDKAGTKAGEYDRKVKGAARATSNGTKEFAKMAQGMGGLVQAYATVAATVFAVSAAFQFLKSAADYRVVKDSQVAFSSATGVGMRSLTKDLQDASDNMLSFKDASEAAAIGIASGLSQTQLKQLGKGAANVSKILGRDVTDSFNRLVRGVTKAEPELLDELGITLRLADAQEKYASKLGKSANSLSMYEKKQAVFNEVQGQLEEKYNRIAELTDINGNALNKLAVAFDRVLNPIKDLLSSFAEPVAIFFSENIKSLGIAFAALAVPIIKSVIPGLENFAKNAKESSEKATKSLEKYKDQVKSLKEEQERLSRAPIEQAQALVMDKKARKGSGLEAFQKGEELTKRQIKGMIIAAEAGKGVVADMTDAQKKTYLAGLRQMEAGNKKFSLNWKQKMNSIVVTTKIGAKRMQAAWAGAMRVMSRATLAFSRVANTASKAAGWIGVAMIIWDAGKSLLGALGVFEKDKAIVRFTENLQELTRSMEDNLRETKNFAEIQEVLMTNMATDKKFAKPTLEVFKNLGEYISTTSDNILDTVNALNLMSKATDSITDNNIGALSEKKTTGTGRNKKTVEDTTKEILQADYSGVNREAATETVRESAKAMIGALQATGIAATEQGKEFLALNDILYKNGSLTKEQAKSYEELAEKLKNTGGEAAALLELQKKNRAEYKSTIAGITQYNSSVSSLLRSLQEEKNAINAKDYENKEAQLAIVDEQIAKIQKLHDLEVRFAAEKARIEAAASSRRGLFGGAPAGLMAGQYALQDATANAQNTYNEARAQRDMAVTEKADPEKLARMNSELDKAANNLELAKFNMSDIGQIANNIEESLGTNLANALNGLVTGTMTIKEAFANMALGILQALAQIITQLIAVKILQSAIGMFNTAPTPSAGSAVNMQGMNNYGSFARYGGMFSGGKEVSGYSMGGIAKGSDAGYPAVLHGTEAVVPLPNNKSIPVDLKGAGQNNNVVVNVSMGDSSSSASTSEQSGADAGKLGQVIAQAVQKELQNQKRSGGILSPYGVA